MKIWAVALTLMASGAIAQDGVTFAEYKVSTEVASDLSRQCRVEIQREHGDRCDRFFSHMENHMALYTQFNNRLKREGDAAYGDADSVELSMYQRALSQLNNNMRYINTMSELNMQ